MFLKLCGEISDKEYALRELAHIAFWHRYYAASLTRAADGDKPNLLNGTYSDINKLIEEFRSQTPADKAVEIIQVSQKELVRAAAKAPGSLKLKYKQGSRYYTLDEYLDTIAYHLKSHNKSLKRR